MRKRGGYWKNFSQRWANYAPEIVTACKDTQRIWVHAVSVGECNLALKFINEFRKKQPEASFVLSVNTSTAHTLAQSNIDARDVLVYFPLDISPIIKKVFNVLNPKFIVLTEKEVWPNLVRRANKKNIPIFLINGTISTKSYNSYKKLGLIFKPIFSGISKAYMQSEEDAKRIQDLGIASDDVQCAGSLKYVVTDVDTQVVDNMKKFLSDCGFKDTDTIITAASTWPGEEFVFANAFKKLKIKYEHIKLIIIPRHVERREQIIAELQKTQQDFVIRSNYLKTQAIDKQADIILLDSTGEVKPVYALSSIAFVGKSMFENHGGHNIIEPATFSIPLLTGPNTENFPIISQDFINEDGITIVENENELYKAIAGFISDPEMSRVSGKKARAVLDKRLGNLDRIIDQIISVS
jgi:3-deoxy-D-manno-octulosonic-acid transferase